MAANGHVLRVRMFVNIEQPYILYIFYEQYVL